MRARRAEGVAEEERARALNERDHALQSEQAATAQKKLAESARRETEQNLYAADMNVAQAAWEAGNIGRLRGLLEETRTFPNRGFEWYFWQRQTHLNLITFYGHVDTVNSIALFPDGKQIVTGSDDGTAKPAPLGPLAWHEVAAGTRRQSQCSELALWR